MIDLHALRDNPDFVIARIKKKDPSYDIEGLVKLDKAVRSLRLEIENLSAQKNELARKARSGITDELRAQSKDIDTKIKERQHELENTETTFKDLYLRCPNLADDSIPEGNKESNRVIKSVGQKPVFNFPVKNHVDLATLNKWFDFKDATTIASGGFVLYRGQAARLLYGLAMFMLRNNKKHGFEFVIPPDLVNERSLEVSGNFPKFADQVYAVPADNLYLSPTAEVGLTNVYRDYIFSAQELPVRMTAWTSCFRREAGGYGATERGLIRIHQFEKVELYTLCTPENSKEEHERMLACAEDILQQLGLHYRVSLLAGQDCSFQANKTYDIEVWLPGQGTYYEVSSVSNCTDFQARRGAMRFKETPDSKTRLVHTLNGSSLALPRLMVALMEVYQQEDGTIALPSVIQDDPLFL